MQELVVNLHMHTRYSDGTGSHRDIASAALRSSLDAVIVTDHNVWVSGPEDYYKDGDRHVLLMVGEEIHDPSRSPQKNHLLVLGARRELASYASDPQHLLDVVKQAGGLAFIAHPVDPAAPAVHQEDISWISWEVQGYTGIELWNGFSEFKSRLKTKLHALWYAYQPWRIARGPLPEAIKKWDEFLAEGKRVVAIGGSDAHALDIRLGPLKRTVFPYEFHFRTVNTHVFVPEPLRREPLEDSRLILEAMRQGHAFIGYDLPHSTRGFNITVHGKDQIVGMGDEISARYGVTIQIRLPIRTECRLIRNGTTVKVWRNRDTCTYITTEPGAYRVEVYIQFQGRRIGWIFSNPVYVRP